MATHDQPDGKGSIELRRGAMGAQTGGLAPLQRSTSTSDGIPLANRAHRFGSLQRSVKQLPDIDPIRMGELVESCRAHAASVAELAGVTSMALDQCYGYEENEPHLGQCCELVRQVLEQTESALMTLGVISHDVESRLHAEVAEGCELQRRSLTRAMHVVRATSAILGTFESNSHDHVLLALYDLESGIQFLIDGLRRVTKQ
jgi:hypothetical protein